MEISMYTAGTKPFIFLKFYHTNGKSMEISMYKTGTKTTNIVCNFTMPSLNGTWKITWKFPCIRPEQNRLYS